MEKNGENSESEIPIAAEQSIRSSVYMCFQVMKTDKSPRWIIQALNLSHLSTRKTLWPPWPPETLLNQVLYTGPDLKLPSRPGCGVFGSKIVFGGGQYFPEDRFGNPRLEVSKEIFEFETDASEPKMKRSEKEFISGKSQTMLMTLADGKLYALSFPQVQYVDYRKEYMPAFEVFDSTKKTWLPLPQPPFEGLTSVVCNFDLCYATVENTIFLSTPNTRMYRFDAANPAKGWTKHSETPLPCTVGRALVLKDDDHSNNYIMFAYHSSRDSIIGVYLMSSPDYFLRHIASLVVLPPQLQLQLPPEFLPVDRYSIVHLGGRIVCLVLGKFIPSTHDCGIQYCMAGANCYAFVKEKMSIFVVIFEYFLSPGSLTMDFTILDSRLLQFDTNQYGDLGSAFGCMLGAFFLGDPIQGGNGFADHGVKSPNASKDINLNPGAKLSTSLSKRTTPSAVATAANVGCIPNHSSLVPIAGFQQNPCPSCSFGPDSMLPYMNFQTGIGGSSSQCQYAGSVLAGPGYMYPNTSSMVGWQVSGVSKLFQAGLGCVYPNDQAMVGHMESGVRKLGYAGLGYLDPNYQAEEYDY